MSTTNLSTTELIRQAAQRTDLTQDQVKEALSAILAVTAETAALGQSVTINGFAKVEGVDKPERITRNPQNGEPIIVAAHRAPRLKPLKLLKDTVAGRVPIQTGRA